jgi:tetratricopeptide (TPR) repeat protein
MKNLKLLLFCTISALNGYAQGITQPIPGGNKKASVSEIIGITKVSIDYDRPAVKGRENKIWGAVVPYGFVDYDYGTSKAAPWRAGANENTVLEFDTEVLIEGKSLLAGKYGFFVAMGKEKATLIFSKTNTAWGSFYYEPKEDILRVDVPVIYEKVSVERLKYEFSNQSDQEATITLAWEYARIPFKVSVDLTKQRLEAYRREFNNGNFYRYWQNMHAAANFCLVNDTNLKEGLSWAERAITTYFGEANFLTLSTYAGMLEKNGLKAKADSVMAKAFPMATMLQFNTYGGSLLKMKKDKEALEIFKLNFEKHPDDIYTCLGMTRGYYFNNNVKEAIKYAEKGKEIAKDDNTKSYFETILTDIKSGKQLTR